MGSTIKRPKGGGKDAGVVEYRAVTLTCGCGTDRQPTISSPVRKWFCCGEYRKARA
jgi:hypothetical protein